MSLRRKSIYLLTLPIFLTLAHAQHTDSPSAKRGAILYEQHCTSCHQKDGNGVPRLIPPLQGAAYVTGDKTRLIRVLLLGLNERIEVLDEEYFSPMASFQQLSDQQLADMLTYVRARFGGRSSSVSVSEVRTQRKKSSN
ncbi:MAG: c-type cytochrome [Bacteroidota bacterium]